MEYPDNLRVLAVDPGTKRWGVAVGDSATGRAKPLLTVTGETNVAIAKIIKLAQSERVDCILLGRPVNEFGSEHAITRLSDFASSAFTNAGFQVVAYDEHLTSFSAEQSLKDTGTRFSHNKSLVDRVAAALMLEAAFREQLFKTALTP